MLVDVIKHPRKLLNFARKIRIARQLYDKPYGEMLARFFRLARHEGYTPREIFLWDLLGPSFAEHDLRSAMSKRDCVTAQLRLNPASASMLTEDKSVFYPYCRAHGLPTPRLLAIVGPHLGWTAEGTVLGADGDWQQFFAELSASDIVIKPSLGVYARGVRILQRQGDRWLSAAGRELTPAEIVADLRADADYNSFIVQERVRNHPDLRKLSDSDYLQTLRIVTFVSGKGEPQILFCLLRLITGSATTDNFHQGQTGNLLADVCLERGRIAGGFALRPCGVGLEEVTHHPATGVALFDVAVPFWRESCDLARRAAMQFLPLVTIGWDLAITEEGPLLIEGNVTWSPIHSAQKKMHIFRDHSRALLDGTGG